MRFDAHARKDAVLTTLVARGSDGARAGLAIVAAVVLVLTFIGGVGAGSLGAVVLIVAVAALFVPSSEAWFREIRGRRR